MPIAMTEITCKCGCKQKKMVRTADVDRGWGLFINRSHKQKWQEAQKKARAEKKTGFEWNKAIQQMNNLNGDNDD
jgi:hypothetical protein